ncbi:hypothetical protein RF11_06019 [Thelohanellus kitauei]|uniref:Uncharacterized protein n=1 Tax=Thelohanellus kitauei TaxID=669202 RepID=A0A0C2JQI8_THEKT|nr:hypothetical protein RF11_06019 [Thelohanellus kitauei]
MVGYHDETQDTILNKKTHCEKGCRQRNCRRVENHENSYFFKNFCADETGLNYRLRQKVRHAINTLHYLVIKRRWTTLLCYAVQICQKMLLLVYNCAALPHLDNLQNIQLEFLPLNTKSIMQPMDMEFVADSWRLLITTTIQNCFTNCGFKPLDISEIVRNEENEDMLPVHIIKYEEFSTIDNTLPCYDNNEDCEDLIGQEDDDESPMPVTNHEAKKCMAVLQRFFMQEGNQVSITSALNICADFVDVKCYKNKRRTTLE